MDYLRSSSENCTHREHSGTSSSTPSASTSASGQGNCQEDEDPERRKNNIKKTCNLTFRVLTVRHFTKKARITFDEKFDVYVSSLLQANERIVERMLSYVEVMHHSWSTAVLVPEQAIKRMYEALRSSNALNTFHELNRDHTVVQVDEIFSGMRADGTSWSITFTIDADIPPAGERQTPHFGITIERENGSYRNLGHNFVSVLIPFGRAPPREQSSNSENTTWPVAEVRLDNGTFKHERKVTYLKKRYPPRWFSFLLGLWTCQLIGVKNIRDLVSIVPSPVQYNLP